MYLKRVLRDSAAPAPQTLWQRLASLTAGGTWPAAAGLAAPSGLLQVVLLLGPRRCMASAVPLPFATVSQAGLLQCGASSHLLHFRIQGATCHLLFL